MTIHSCNINQTKHIIKKSQLLRKALRCTNRLPNLNVWPHFGNSECTHVFIQEKFNRNELNELKPKCVKVPVSHEKQLDINRF